MATLTEVAFHLDMTDDGVAHLQTQGIMPRPGRGKLDIDECRIAYIRHLRRERKAPVGKQLDTERTRLAAEQADREAMRNARERGELAPVADTTNAVLDVITITKARLMKLPAKAARGDKKLEERIRREMVAALTDLSQTRVEELRNGTGDDAEDDTDDATRLA